LKDDYRKLLEALDKPESNPMQFFDVILLEEWAEE